MPVLLTSGTFAACASFGGTDTAPASDAGGDVSSDVDAGRPLDGSVADATASSDGAAEASGCGIAGRWLCDSFDRAGTLDSGLTGVQLWSSGSATGVATLAIMPSNTAVSLPNVLTVVTSGAEEATVTAVRSGPGSGVRCSFSVRLEQEPQFGTLLMQLDLSTPTMAHYRLTLHAGVDSVDEIVTPPDGFPVSDNAVPLQLAPLMWHSVWVEVVLGPGGHSVFKLDGKEVSFPASSNLASLSTPNASSLQLGSQAGVGSGSWSVDYDDVVCDLLP